jgi:uncharacterized protein
MTETMRPTGSRIAYLDALRGYALLGILICHYIHWHMSPFLNSKMTGLFHGLSFTAEQFNDFFLTNKFIILFSFIFGISFQLQSVGFRKYTDNVNVLFVRRACCLFLIGAAHYLFWFGDILFIYGALMLFLLLFRKVGNVFLLIAATLLASNLPGFLLYLYKWHHMASAGAAVSGAVVIDPKVEELYGVMTHGSLMDNIRFNLHFIHTRLQFQIWSGSYFVTFGFFLYGMLVARAGWLRKIDQLRRNYPLIVLTGLAMLWVLHYCRTQIGNAADQHIGLKLLTILIAYLQGVVSILTNASIVALLFSIPIAKKLTEGFAVLGKMALTNYLMQTVVGLVLFYPFGLGLFLKTSPAVNVLIALGTIVLQWLFSKIWLRYFSYGPVEWLLRMGTFGKYFRNRVPDGTPAVTG